MQIEMQLQELHLAASATGRRRRPWLHLLRLNRPSQTVQQGCPHACTCECAVDERLREVMDLKRYVLPL